MTPRLLLVSPVFQGYWRALERSFSERGWDVDVHLYDQPGTVAARAANIVAHATPFGDLTQRMNEHLTELAISRLTESKYDAVLVLRGDQLTARWWDALRDTGLPAITWAYDELRRMRPEFAQNASIGTIATYSAPDASTLVEVGHDAFHLPLAFDTHSPIEPSAYPAITFIGARYPNREAQLTALHRSGVSVMAFGKTWSTAPQDRIRSRQFRTPEFRTGPQVDRPGAYGIMAGSLATLNIHGDQEGFTMRTFEAAGVGGVQLIDRADVEDFYTPGEEVLTFQDDAELLELCHRIARRALPTDALRKAARRRTLAEHTFDHRVVALLERL